jgi:hypothetical protein
MSITRDRARESHTGGQPAALPSAQRQSAGAGTGAGVGPAPGGASAFEALISPRNIMSLHGQDYLRMGLLGKGGSSKVFRVLAQTGEVRLYTDRPTDRSIQHRHRHPTLLLLLEPWGSWPSPRRARRCTR